VKDSVLKQHPWVARSLHEAFAAAKAEWLATLSSGQASAATDKKYRELIPLVGPDPLPFGLAGIQSDWSKERPASDEQMIDAMDEAGVAKTAIVHASTCYGFDNSYVADAVARFPHRCGGVGSIDMLAPDAAAVAKNWLVRGITGLRIFTGGSTKKVDASTLDDARSYPVWKLMSERGLSMCVQTGIPATISLANRFPNVPIILDHFGRPDAGGGPPYDAAAPLMSLAALSNVYLKFTPVVLNRLKECNADVHAFMAKLVQEFGANRIAWGSNWPNSPGTLKQHVAIAKAALAGLSEADRDAILGGTALRLYPALRDW
jgi:L-fuconolactonase